MKEQPGARIDPHDKEPHRGASRVTQQMAEASPRRWARIVGSLGLINIVFGAISFAPGLLVVSDVATTAYNIQTHELLYRLALAAHLVICVSNVLSTVFFYDLMKVVNRRLALLDVFFTLVATSVETTSLLLQVVPLVLLGSGLYASALPAAQLQALAYLPNDLSTNFYSIYGILYGIDWIIVAYLVFRSTFLPRTIGVLLAIDALAYLVYGFADLLAPGFAAHLVPWIQSPSLLSEGSFSLWLLIVGVNVKGWKERASAASQMWSTQLEATTMIS